MDSIGKKNLLICVFGHFCKKFQKIENDTVLTAQIKYNYPILTRIKLVSMKIHILIFEKKSENWPKPQINRVFGPTCLFENVQKIENPFPHVTRGGKVLVYPHMTCVSSGSMWNHIET